MDITELVIQIQAGNTDAFSKVYDLYADRIFRYIRLKVSDQQSAEDILQDVFIKVWANCGSLKIQDMKFSAWVYKIASNTVNDFYRKKYRRPERSAVQAEKRCTGQYRILLEHFPLKWIPVKRKKMR